jgi:hypothetical protein
MKMTACLFARSQEVFLFNCLRAIALPAARSVEELANEQRMLSFWLTVTDGTDRSSEARYGSRRRRGWWRERAKDNEQDLRHR